MSVATKIQLPYLENTGLDGKKLYTPKEWTERFRHYIKRIHKNDIKKNYEMTQYQPATSGIEKNQKSDKTSSGAPDRRQSRLS